MFSAYGTQKNALKQQKKAFFQKFNFFSANCIKLSTNVGYHHTNRIQTHEIMQQNTSIAFFHIIGGLEVKI